MHLEATLLALFAVAAVVAIVSHRMKMPYTIALVLTGLALGLTGIMHPPHLTKELLFLIVLPGLLFEAAFHMHFDEFWKAKVSIFSLAIPGLLVAIGLTGFGIWGLVGETGLGELTLLEAMVFGSLIGATDPISVLAIFKTLGVDRRLYVLVEGESLFNDGTAVVIFTILLGLVMGGEASAGGAMFEFVKVVGMAALIGGAVGYLGSVVTSTLEEPVIEITLTALVAYGAFIIAEHFHFSGVIACVIAGMLMGNWGARMGMSPTTRLAVVSFWEYAAFVLNSLVFLLVGFEVKFSALLDHAGAIVLAWGVVLAGRAAVVFLKRAIVAALGGEKMPASWAAVLTWGGLRGSLSMVLALALPKAFEHREFILHLTFGVVLLSLVGQGLSMKWVLTRLGLVGDGTIGRAREIFEARVGRLRAAHAALKELEAMRANRTVPTTVYASLKTDYEAQVEALEEELTELTRERPDLIEAERESVHSHLLVVEKEALRDSVDHGQISPEIFGRLRDEVDRRILDLHHPSGPDTSVPPEALPREDGADSEDSDHGAEG